MTEEERIAAEEAAKKAEEAAKKAEEERLAAEAGKNQDQDIVKRLVTQQVEGALKDIKSKLDNAYRQRDEAQVKLAEIERKANEERLKRMEEEGKHKEVLEERLAAERAAREAAEKRNTELSRDVAVRAALNGLDFRNERAAEIAFKEIIADLVKKDDGSWVHKSGVTIHDFIMDFSKDENQSFLFKQKSSSGGGSSSSSGGNPPGTSQTKSLFTMSQAEVLKLAEQGKLPNQRK